MIARIAALTLIASASIAAPARAQYVGRPRPHPGTVEIDGGISWNGGYDAGSASANETRNPTTGSAPLQLFQTTSRLAAAPAIDARVGVYVAQRWSIEGGVQVARPTLTLHPSNDFEAATGIPIEETLTQYLFDGSAVYHFTEPGSARVVPFVSGGGGYLRELDAGSATVESGSEIHGGGGLRYWFTGRFGMRVEARVSARSHSADLEGTTKRRIIPTVTAGIAYLF